MECLQLFTNTILTLVSRIPNVCREQSNSSTARGIPDNITPIFCVFICDGNNDYGNLRQLPVERAYSVKLCRGPVAGMSANGAYLSCPLTICMV
jgi:hypothetical protein